VKEDITAVLKKVAGKGSAVVWPLAEMCDSRRELSSKVVNSKTCYDEK
jgi:hypothetical protein